ncbi:hypothetical protein [Desulfopila inferna]|uniref:hypothetical protein n=1 Tax=Desulfopila inferna TaxID=468528 RepID=UPI001963DA3E|nr:hypothetical protein [Desulfopila inferna]MBM9603966.1 hypothetical protein [Desulfopila inferna]
MATLSAEFRDTAVPIKVIDLSAAGNIEEYRLSFATAEPLSLAGSTLPKEKNRNNVINREACKAVSLKDMMTPHVA